MPKECSVIISPYTIMISSIFLLCLILSLLGNAIVILTILGKSHRSRSITNFYLLNLAFADLLRSIICIPSTLLGELTQCWLLGAAMCKIVAFLQPVGVCASAYTLAVIAIERYYAICRPLESRKWQTKKRALITISLVWCFSFSANLTSLFLYDANPGKFTCDSTKGPLVDFIYQLYLTFTLLFVPLALMVGLYGNVIITLNTAINSDHPTVEQQMIEKTLPSRASFSDWFVSAVQRVPSMKVVSKTFQFKEKNSLSIPQTSGLSVRPSRSSFSSFFSTPRGSFDVTMLLRSTNQEKILIAKKKVTRMLITLVIVFAFCWVPSYLYWLLLRMAELAATDLWNPGLNSSLTIMTYISSLANPITYCFMNKSFRSSVLAYCRPKPKRPLTRCSALPTRKSPSSPTHAIPMIKIDLVLDSSVHI
ncbi:G-protein coupled receptors family 1 profile domain-containing protein [Caenorhabditis elegans]|uniref:G-protein coupled receptors family 1 profile domain-containing protein n=1 Tax=Caenorhabditis elegans TaxID=6239 RepID=P91487_CAEEL|nr:G-protein coupled receptors family 1 profile domain-containing protein [Caenorhabditis elegans]CCD64898.1 G-protein coupled receptors family 1 profile domain-containing protein [Caenorhabditis elegans]|eukprot:NP_491918.3 CholecystoKinin Receptor homolog [Caenorhabditis elegans]